MNPLIRDPLLSLLALVSLPALAAPGVYFSHKDWEIACDNTGTCRAAGYQADNAPLPVSVLLTRKAGPAQPAAAEVQLGTQGSDGEIKLPASFQADMRIDGQSLGKLNFTQGVPNVLLNSAQTSALLSALKGDGRITWQNGEHIWTLSGQGASAVLLKMDDFQGRVGTTGALVRKGDKDESGVLAPTAVPRINVPSLPATRTEDGKLAAQPPATLLASLRAALPKPEECEKLGEAGGALTALRLDAQHLLISTQCWSAAYNAGDGYWVVDDKAPYHATLVTTSGGEFLDGLVSAEQLGRGIGDCSDHHSWAWDGHAFVSAGQGTNGLCKLFAGGAWELPTEVVDIHMPAGH